jgi:hypothetical protein
MKDSGEAAVVLRRDGMPSHVCPLRFFDQRFEPVTSAVRE